MSQQIAEFFAKITADTAPAQQSLQKFQGQLEKTAAKVKQGGGVVDGLKNHIAGLVNPTTLAIGGFTVLGAKVASSFGDYQRYAHDVRNLSIATSQNAQETSILIQTLDDFEISVGDAQTAARALKEKGLSPTVETLAKLSDQFRAIQDPAERLKFAQDNLGRSYQSYLNLLSAGGDKIMKTAEGTNKWNILTDEQMKTAEEARLKMDALADAWQGFWIQIGAGVGGMIVAGDRQATIQEKLQGLYGMTFDEMRKASIGNRDFAEAVKATEGQLRRGAAATEYYNNLIEKGIVDTQSAAERQEELAGVILGTGFNFVAMNEKVAATEQDIKDKFEGATTVTSAYATELARLAKARQDGTMNENQYERALDAVNKKHEEGQLDKVITNTQNSAYATQLYQQALQDLKTALADGAMTQEQFSQASMKLNADFASGEFAARKQAEAMGALRDAANQSFEEQALAALKAKEATNQQQLDFAVAAGLMTQDAANQAKAMDTVTDAFKNGSLTAQGYVEIVHRLAEALNGLNGTEADVMINMMINAANMTQQEGGSGAAVAAAVAGAGGNKNKENKPKGGAHAGGGRMSGEWALLGDMPGAKPTAWSEMVHVPTMTVYDAQTTRQMLASGMFDFTSYAFPSDPYTTSGTGGGTKPKVVHTTNRTRGGGGRTHGGGGGFTIPVGLEEPGSSPAVVDANMQTAIQVGQQVAQQVATEIKNGINNKMDELIAVQLDANPRAIGNQLKYYQAMSS